MATGRIFDIQRFSLHDGPGIRTVVFFKGCPLRCLWCHNPEGLHREPELLVSPEKCIGCGECAGACPRKAHTFAEGIHSFDREKCIGCGACVPGCPAEALALAGKTVTVEEIMETVLRDKAYFAQSGGLTVSGGEPLLQPDFLRALLRAAKEEKLSTCMETSGYAAKEVFESVLPDLDLVLFDIKLLDDAAHRQATGVPLAPIMENLHTLDKKGIDTILRCPIIPGINQSEAHIRAVAALANSLGCVRGIHLEPYHTLGLTKAVRLGIAESFTAQPPEPEEMQALLALLQQETAIPAKIS